ncbi:MAG TPA: efflux RND transporter permease subunit [Crenotrichaceae bacterium]|nr:efflux RND transporter permease subunit [Crenotrichaceae bacterium]
MNERYRLIAWFSDHKVAGNLLMLAMIIGGFIALGKLNIQFFPRFDLDFIRVSTVWQDASAEDVETSITIPLEQSLRTVDGLRKMDSTSAEGVSSIFLEFKEGSDIVVALNQVKQRVDEFRNLPEDAEEPEVVNIIAYEPVVRLLLTGDASSAEFRQLANQYERELLDRGIANIQISGLPEEELAIEISTRQLSELNMSQAQIASQIAELSRDIPSGSLGERENSRQLRTLNQRKNESAFSRLAINAGTNTRIQLGSIANIERRPKQDGVTLTVADKPAVEMVIRRSPDGDALEAADIVEQWLAEKQQQLPAGIELQAFDKQYQYIIERIQLLLKNGASGLLLLVIILYLFLAPRVAFWVAFGIPVSFLATLLVHYLVGGTIDMLSLFALIMALGVIVDDAIVVGEEALTQFHNGATPQQAAQRGATRMFAPVLASALTTIGAFFPLMSIGGPTGKILFALPLVMIAVVFASLVESIFVLPSHLRASFSNMQKHGQISANLGDHFHHFKDYYFRPVIGLALRYREATISLIIALFIFSIGVLASGRVPFNFFPSPDGTVIYVNAKFLPGIPSTEVDRFMLHVYQVMQETDRQLSDDSIVVHAITRHGITSGEENDLNDSGDHIGSMVVEVTDPDDRGVANMDFINTWHQRVIIPPGLDTFTIRQKLVGPPGKEVSIRLTGANAPVLKQAAQDLANQLKTVNGVINIDDNTPFGREQWVFNLTPLGQQLGLTDQQLGQQLHTAFDGVIVQRFQDGPDEVEVRVMLPASEREHMATLQSLNITLQNGTTIPLQSVAEWHAQQGFEVLRHAEGTLAVEVTSDVDRGQNTVEQALLTAETEILPELAKKYGITAAFSGRSAEESQTMTDMKYGAVVGLTLIYLVLAAVFSSYGWPLVVMTAIPFGLIGALFGHWLLGIDMTILSMFGLFGLSGIIVNDSIILATCYQELRSTGMAINEALEEAACRRLRAVLLTSLTTIAGLTPLLFETSIQAKFLIPMAASIAFGLAFGTILVLFFIPVLLSCYEHIGDWLNKHRTRLERQTD